MMIAFAFVSVQFSFLDAHHPDVSKGSCLDDRNLRGDHQKVFDAYRDVTRIDTAAGHYINPSKLAATATTEEGRADLRAENVGTVEDPLPPRFFLVEKLVGDALVTKKAPARALSDARMTSTLQAAERVDRLPCAAAVKARALACNVIPKMLKGTQWTLPAKTTLKQLMATIMTGIWSRK